MELAAALHHSRDVRHGTHFGPQPPKTASTAAGTQYYFLENDEVPAAGERPTCLVEPRERIDRPVLQRRRDVDAPSLDVPALQMIEEVDGCASVESALTASQQVMTQDVPAVPVPSSVGRVAQPTDVEQVLSVPVPHMDHDDTCSPSLWIRSTCVIILKFKFSSGCVALTLLMNQHSNEMMSKLVTYMLPCLLVSREVCKRGL